MTVAAMMLGAAAVCLIDNMDTDRLSTLQACCSSSSQAAGGGGHRRRAPAGPEDKMGGSIRSRCSSVATQLVSNSTACSDNGVISSRTSYLSLLTQKRLGDNDNAHLIHRPTSLGTQPAQSSGQWGMEERSTLSPPLREWTRGGR